MIQQLGNGVEIIARYSILFTENGKSVLHGVTSWGFGCGDLAAPGNVFANVFTLTNFIRDIIVSVFWFFLQTDLTLSGLWTGDGQN